MRHVCLASILSFLTLAKSWPLSSRHEAHHIETEPLVRKEARRGRSLLHADVEADGAFRLEPADLVELERDAREAPALGPEGPRGEPGARGEEGPAGDKGPQGPQGDKG
ncbi:unnamed protein product, partial [Effrenium voratum]